MKALTTLIFMLLSSWGWSQAGEYRKILESKTTQTSEEFFFALQDFQKKNPQFSNVYFQLGEMNLDFFKNQDPVINRISSRQYIYNAKINYGLSGSFYDEKEAIKNPEWFNLPKMKEKDSLLVLISEKVNGMYDSVVSYSERYEDLISNYDKAVQKYLSSREGFIAINNSSNNLRELFLKADENLEQTIDQVGEDFDSAMYYLGRYRDIYQTMPYPRKRQVFVNRKRIEHFRMNGITPSNFLADQIDVWDYGRWSRDFRELLREEVDGLKGEITEAYQTFQRTNQLMLFGEECLQANLENLKLQRIINLVTKYDNQSILIDVFTYIGHKLDFGNKYVYEKNCNIIESLPSDDIISRKARAFQNIYDSWAIADSTVQLILNSPHNQDNFSWFYGSDMPEGATGFSTSQLNENQAAFTEELVQLYKLLATQRFDSSADTLLMNREDSLFTPDVDRGSDSLIQVYQFMNLNDSSHLVYGEETGTFKVWNLRTTDEEYKVRWEKPMESELDYFKVIGDTSFVSINDRKLRHFYSSGQDKVTFNLPANMKVKNLLYNYLKAEYSFLMQDSETDTLLTLLKMNYQGKTSQQIACSVQGNVITHFNNDGRSWVFSALSQENVTTLYAYAIDPEGEIVDAFEYGLQSELQDIRVIKNDNETITLIAKSTSNEEGYVYALLNYQGEVQKASVF